MANGWGERIVIRGGSAEVEFDPAVFRKDATDPRKHKNAAKKITRIEITGDITFDSGDRPGGLTCVITATYK